MTITADNSQEPAALDDDAASPPPRGTLRHVVDALLSLAVAVILVRSFAVEGYMISTGSMAPTLPGFHKQATCPSCGIGFAVGVTDDANPLGGVSLQGQNGSGDVSREEQTLASCPNCGKDAIDITHLPRTQGDQLLVYKNEYLHRPPRRWEVVVFRNPAKTTQAYVKRVVGLPGETVQLLDGDVWVDGEIERKSLPLQQAMRILVDDHNFEPQDDADWQARWTAHSDGGWNRDGQSFVFAPPAQKSTSTSESASLTWLTYRHWIRSGGRHTTKIAAPSELPPEKLSNPSLFPLEYGGRAHELRCEGVLSESDRERFARLDESAVFKKLIADLAAKSHFAPITDDYGYNRRRRDSHPTPVHDVMFTCRLSPVVGNGRLVVETTDGRERFAFTLDAGTREIFLHRDREKDAVRRARLKPQVLASPMELTVSLFDRQVLVAINDQPVFDPLALEPLSAKVQAPRRPVRIGAVDVHARIDSLKLYRDVHYTGKGGGTSYTVADGEYFVLGDNSPISADSRVWAHHGVEHRLLLGKPFLVHLPSRPGTLRIGKLEMRVRIPDFSRIRYIR